MGIAVLTAVASCLAVPDSGWGQGKKKPVTIKGTVVSLEKKGRTQLLIIENSAKEKQEFKLTSKVDFSIVAKGDDGFLAAGQYVSTIAQLSNNRLFAKKYTVYVGKGRRPKPTLAKAPPKIGRSKNSYLVSGMIVSRQQDKEYADFETITLKVGGRNGTPVFLDKGFAVSVNINDPNLVKPGMPVELQGIPLRGDRVNVLKVTVRLPKPLKAKEYFAEADKKKK